MRSATNSDRFRTSSFNTRKTVTPNFDNSISRFTSYISCAKSATCPRPSIFDRQVYLDAVEIEDVSRHGMLAAELQLTETTIAQPPPDRSLFAGWALPMFPRVLG
jgi:hypothetical protein